MSTLQKVLLTATLAIAVGAAIFQTHQASQLRNQVQGLQKQHTEQIQQLQGERDQATAQLAALREDIERSIKNSEELLKLRGEVTRLRQQGAEIATLRAENSQLRNRAAARSSEPVAANAAVTPTTNTPAAEDAVKQRNQCINNLRQIGAAMEQSALEN